MNYSEKISEFIDGELSQEECSELFSNISQNPGLQDELRQSLLLKNMFHQELFNPPPVSKTHLYAKLNLQRGAVILSFLLTTLINLRRIFVNPAFTSALIGIALFTASYFISNNNENKISDSNKSYSAKSSNEKINQAQTVPFVNSAEKQKEIRNTGTNILKNLKNHPKEILSQNNISEINTKQKNLELSDNTLLSNSQENSQNANTKTLTIEILPVESSQFNSSSLNPFNNSFKSNFFSEIGYELSSILENISLSLNKSLSSSSVKTNLEPLSNPLLNNYSISITYNLDKHNSFAAELGQENFEQKYSGTINGFDADIAQVYTAQWYGLSYQYNFGNIDNFYGINPFLKALVSGTSIGPFVKGSFGISYPLNEKISLVGAVEASKLAYNFNNTWYFTNKYGVIYGVRIGF